ncbi:MAG TPA: protein kinase [Polyangiaceae bacterium]|nr:protein kinase [Polyangiaceae bacterium]
MTTEVPNGVVASARFHVSRHLGSGGMGAVFEAYDRERQQRVALKTLRTQSPEELLHLKNEFRALQDVRHPNLVNLLELSEEAGRFFVTMELVEGTDLLGYVRPGEREVSVSGQTATQLVRSRASEPSSASDADPAEAALSPISRSRPRCDDARVRQAFGQLARGLSALHERGKLHRDVKPANVIVTPEGRTVLVDFGLAVDSGPGQAQVSAGGAGTRAFMAPEQAAGQTLTAAADWYSFGVALYLALSGQLPFHGADVQRQKLRAQPVPLSELCPETSEELRNLALGLLAADPSNRPNGEAVLACFGIRSASSSAAQGPFVGRARELEQLLAAFSTVGTRTSSVLIVADSGLGKSALVRELIAQLLARDPGVLVLAGRCYERELLPYKALDGIVDALSQFLSKLEPEVAHALLPEEAAILTQIFPVLARVATLAKGPTLGPADPQERRAQAFAVLRELFVRLARSHRLLLYIDDLQWADADSHLLLADLLRQPDAPALCLIVTARPGAQASLEGAQRLELAPLSFEEARALASAVLDDLAAPALAPLIAKEANGHPLFVQALAAHAKRAGGLHSAGLRLDDALLAHVDSVDASSRRLLELAVIAGSPLTPTLAARASGQDATTFSSSVSELRALRLVRSSLSAELGEIAPYHDRIREALLDRLSEAQRQALHRDLAQALEGTGSPAADPQRLVRHLEGAGLVARAAEQAQIAAQHAERALAFDQAAELYGTALRLGTFDPPARRVLTLAHAEALANAGRAAESAEAYLRAAVGAEPEARQEYERRAADHLLRSGHSERGTAILAQVLRGLGDRWLSQRGSLAATFYERFRLRLRGPRWSPRPPAAVEPDLLRRVDAYHALGVSLSLIDPARGARFEARALRLALQAGEPRRLGVISVMEACYEGAIGAQGLKAALALGERADQILALTHDPYVAACKGIMVGFLAYHAGEYASAARTLAETEQALAALTGTYFEQAFCHCFGLISLRNRGELAKLRAGYFEWLRHAQRRGDLFTEASLRFNLNIVFLARDEPDEAERELSRVSWMPPDGGYHVQHWYAQQARADIALYCGRIETGLAELRRELKALERALITRMRLHRCHALWLLARFLLARRTPTRELDGLAERLWHEEIGYARTWSLLIQAALRQQRGQRQAALDLLLQAAEQARVADLPQYEQAARYRAGQLLGVELGTEHVQSALAFAAREAISDPARLFDVWAPGF